jgi:RNA polymerase sigma factor (sigma-70 family)
VAPGERRATQPVAWPVNHQLSGSEESGEDAIGNLLDQLSSGRADVAWTEFLKRYSPLIMQVAREFAVGAEQSSECFLFCCEGLSDDGFRRLRGFRRDGPARFRTWLKAVVANLCIDWRRKLYGRLRPPAALADLLPLEQEVYRNIYLRGMTRLECQRALARDFPEVTIDQVADTNARLFKQLSSRQRWQLSHRSRGSVSLDELASPDDESAPLQPEDPRPGPDQLAAQSASRDAVNEALLKLPPRQRLLLRLRYQQELTLEEVARLVGLPDPYRVHREVQAAIAELARHLPREEP